MKNIKAQVISVINNKGTKNTVNNNQVTTANVAPNDPVENDIWFEEGTDNVFVFDIADGWNQINHAAFLNGVEEKLTDYTLVLEDFRKVLTFNSAVDRTLTIPAGLPVGYNISIYQIGDGDVTIVGDDGVMVLNRLLRFRTAGRYAGVGLVSTATNIFHLTGDLKR